MTCRAGLPETVSMTLRPSIEYQFKHARKKEQKNVFKGS